MTKQDDWAKQKELDRERELIVKGSVCGECGSLLIQPWNPDLNDNPPVCAKDRSHTGFAEVESYSKLYDKGELGDPYIKQAIERRRRKEMEEELGKETTTALAEYQGITALTKRQAEHVLMTIWPDAPKEEVLKAALTCASYGLNPLMRHVFLIPFDLKSGKRQWTQVLGIGATRLISSRKGGYGYVNGPRIMTEQEQRDIRGEVDNSSFWAITIVKDKNGNQAPGYGSWPKGVQPKGVDKGNTRQNMAFIRSERQALDRLFPGEMPQGIEVADEDYLPPITVSRPKDAGRPAVVEAEVVEGEVVEPQVQDSQGDVHPWLKNCPNPKHNNAPWFSDKFGGLAHKLEDGTYCKADKLFKGYWEEAVKRMGWLAGDGNNWLKDRYGVTWSRLTEAQQVASIDALRALIDARVEAPGEIPAEFDSAEVGQGQMDLPDESE